MRMILLPLRLLPQQERSFRLQASIFLHEEEGMLIDSPQPPPLFNRQRSQVSLQNIPFDYASNVAHIYTYLDIV